MNLLWVSNGCWLRGNLSAGYPSLLPIFFYGSRRKRPLLEAGGRGSSRRLRTQVWVEVVCGEGVTCQMLHLTGQTVTEGLVWAKERCPLELQSWRLRIGDAPILRAQKPAGSEGSEAACARRLAPPVGCKVPPAGARPCALTPGEARRTHDATFEGRSQLYDRSRTRK